MREAIPGILSEDILTSAVSAGIVYGLVRPLRGTLWGASPGRSLHARYAAEVEATGSGGSASRPIFLAFFLSDACARAPARASRSGDT